MFHIGFLTLTSCSWYASFLGGISKVLSITTEPCLIILMYLYVFVFYFKNLSIIKISLFFNSIKKVYANGTSYPI